MKQFEKCIAIILMLALPVIAFSIEWKITNQATVAWDEVTTLANGDPVPANHTITYRVYLSNANTDPEKTAPILLGETDLLQYTITLDVEGKYFAGVQAVRYDETAVEVSVSDINWSDVNGEYTPNPFGLQHYIKTEMPKNLR